jgi:DNA-directed RNA polymerase specialized sigma24 family protein
VLGCPIGTVKSRLNAARKRLQAAAREWLEEKRT